MERGKRKRVIKGRTIGEEEKEKLRSEWEAKKAGWYIKRGEGKGRKGWEKEKMKEEWGRIFDVPVTDNTDVHCLVEEEVGSSEILYVMQFASQLQKEHAT
jgi:hypothetical protein